MMFVVVLALVGLAVIGLSHATYGKHCLPRMR